jgi:hypothetical protein
VSKQSDFRITFSRPEGWVQLPVTNSEKLERDRELEAWAADKAGSTLDSDASPQQVAQRAQELIELTYSCRARRDWYGLAYYPPKLPGLIAVLDVKPYKPGRKYPEITLDLLEEIYAKYSSDTVGDIAASRVKLPAGSAVRVQSKRIEERDKSSQGTVVEGVTHAILPPGIDSAVVVVMTWTMLQWGETLAKMADMIAETVRVTPR